MNIRTATKDDIPTLIDFRFSYLYDDVGELTPEQTEKLNKQLPTILTVISGRISQPI